jgi:hypothetical protein
MCDYSKHVSTRDEPLLAAASSLETNLKRAGRCRAITFPPASTLIGFLAEPEKSAGRALDVGAANPGRRGCPGRHGGDSHQGHRGDQRRKHGNDTSADGGARHGYSFLSRRLDWASGPMLTDESQFLHLRSANVREEFHRVSPSGGSRGPFGGQVHLFGESASDPCVTDSHVSSLQLARWSGRSHGPERPVMAPCHRGGSRL